MPTVQAVPELALAWDGSNPGSGWIICVRIISIRQVVDFVVLMRLLVL